MKGQLKTLRAKVGNARTAYDAETDPKKRTASRAALAGSVLTFRTARLGLLQAWLAKETDPAKRKAISSKISAVLARISAGVTKTKYRLEEEETTEEDDEEEEEEGGNETDREEETEDEDEKKAESEEEEAAAEDDKEPPGDDDKDKKARKGSTALAGQVAALTAEVTNLRARLADVDKREAQIARTSTLDAALKAKRITPAEKAMLSKKPQAFIDAFLEARPKAVVLSPEEALRPLPQGAGAIGRAEGGAPEAQVQLTTEQEKMLADVNDPKLREAILKNWAARSAARETA